MQPISDEAHLEAAASAEVAKTLGFEPTEVDSGDAAEIKPLEGLELDQPPTDSVEISISAVDLDIERTTEAADRRNRAGACRRGC